MNKKRQIVLKKAQVHADMRLVIFRTEDRLACSLKS
jgi:hypothetical protein